MSPKAEATIGPWLAKKINAIQIVSSRVNPVDLAKIVIPIEGVEVDAISEGMEIEIRMGYREYGLWKVFSGVVDDVDWGRVVTISAKDGMEQLRKTKITQTFVDTQPREIMRFCLEKAGASDYRISEQELPLKHYFVVPGLDVLKVQKLVNRTWNLDWEFFREPEGEIVYKPLREAERYRGGSPVALLEYGQNLFDLKTSDDQIGSLRTFLLPMIRHSHVIALRDRRFWLTDTNVQIERIVSEYGSEGAGMVMEWKKAAET